MRGSAQHEAVTGGIVEGEEDWLGLQVAYPQGMQAFTKDAKGRQEAAYCDRKVGMGNVIGLQIFNCMVHNGGTPLAVVAIEVHAHAELGLNQKLIANREQQDGIELWIDVRRSRTEVGLVAHHSRDNGDRPSLGGDAFPG